MKHSIVYATLLAFLLPGAGVFAQTFYPDELFVAANVLNLREKPDKSGKVMEKLSRGGALTFVEAHDNGAYVMVDSINGMWLKVKSKNNNGYVFSPFVLGAYNLFFENDGINEAPPPLHYYGVYMRDSFADELRKIEVRMEETYDEFRGGQIQMLKTNQKDRSKFIIGTIAPLKTGYAGPLGLFDPGFVYANDQIYPGATLPISTGQEAGDTTATPTYFFLSTGCADFQAGSDYVLINNFRVYLTEMNLPPNPRQDITAWLKPAEGINPSISLMWYGDLDGDHKPDAIVNDCPEEVGCRASLFLSSKARPGEYLRKVCEYFYPYD